MNRALVFGSLNLDKVYSLPHLPEKGETLTCTRFETHVGGKGLNQALSLRRAGVKEVYMAGAVGGDGRDFLCGYLEKNSVDTSFVRLASVPTGCAVIEVDPEGQNQMILFPGANYASDEEYCETVLSKGHFGIGDIILMQYETSSVDIMINKAKARGMTVAFNPSPYSGGILSLPLGKIDFFILNEQEGAALTGKTSAEDIASALREKYPASKVILTLGGDGAVYADKDSFVRVPAFKVNAVDTTGAGDTFTGYVLKALADGFNPSDALTRASAASAIAVTKPGAAETIPTAEEVEMFLKNNL